METEAKRIINWWLTWEDLNWPSMDIADKIKRRAEKAAEANVTTAILFGAHFRWDWLPYFTLLHDHIAATAEELHKYGIELYDRHSINLIHRYDTPEQMRHVMLHSGPHIPFSPSREAAACWEYNGKRLNDWRMIDVRDRSVLYYPQYASEGFCYRNPDFIEAYCDYAKKLVSDTGIDGLSAEDPVHYMHYISCACPHCRAELKRRAGIDLPQIDDRSFWGNWENPAWKDWLNLRFDAGRDFFVKLTAALPENFRITTCGVNSASPGANGSANDARSFAAGGSNYVHLEMSGNTPPYKNDPVTVNNPITAWLTSFSHHQAVAREKGQRCFSTGYGFTVPTANIIWAVNKILDIDCCFSTLKARLGLPEHILKTLPTEADVVGDVFGFEKAHPELFNAEQIAEVGVYFSYETRKHSFFGNLTRGYYNDYSDTLKLLFKAGITAHTVFSFPKDTSVYSVILLSSAAIMTDEEKKAMELYVKNGGKVVVTGPSALKYCTSDYDLPTCPDIDAPKDFFSTIANGVWHTQAKWITDTVIQSSNEPNRWREIGEGIFFNPHRVSEGNISDEILEICKKYAKHLPIVVEEAEGYIITLFENEDSVIVHFLAEDYDTDIDHELDDMRFHRSRVNFVNKVAAAGVTDTLKMRCDKEPEVYIPFGEQGGKAEMTDGVCSVFLPQNTAYVILKFKK